MSTIMKAAILMLVATIFGSTDAQNYSQKSWGFIATFNGVYSNRQRINEGFTNHTPINGIARPVSAPALGQGPMMVLEVGEEDGRMEFRHLLVPSDVEESVLKISIYNFTGGNTPGVGQFNTDLLLNYTKDDFSTDPSCVIGMEMLSPGIFFGDWPVCTKYVNNRHPAWGVIVTCNDTAITIPLGGDEVRNFIPYDQRRVADKFPLINPPPGYVNPCDIKVCQ